MHLAARLSRIFYQFLWESNLGVVSALLYHLSYWSDKMRFERLTIRNFYLLFFFTLKSLFTLLFKRLVEKKNKNVI